MINNDGDNMNKPTRRDTINLRMWMHSTGVETIEGICGVIVFPLAIHRPLSEHNDIQQGRRSRFSNQWQVTHMLTGKGMGIRSGSWENIVGFVQEIADHPALLMMDDDTMTNHPMYDDLISKHREAKQRWRL